MLVKNKKEVKNLKRYLGLAVVFLVVVLLYRHSFSRFIGRLNDEKVQTVVSSDEAYGVVRKFINLANKKDQETLEKEVVNRGLDLGFDVLLAENIKLLEVVGVPQTSRAEISALVLAFDEAKEEFSHYVLLFIKDDVGWFLYGFFRQF